jgi:SAM-dependent methyltransferase
MAPPILDVPRRFRRGQHGTDDEENMQSALWCLDHLAASVGVADLGAVDLLDIGCGVKFTEAILTHDLPVRRYIGVDVYREMVEFLQGAVTDPRFTYAHIDAHNDLYNPDGRPLADFERFPIGDDLVDVVCLFSVFTHLAPHDFQAMLRLARAHVQPGGALFFTLFLHETTPGGVGLVDALARRGVEVPDPPPPFADLEPAEPLKWAVYSRSHALDLVEGTGWEVVRLDDPVGHVQHHVVATAV